MPPVIFRGAKSRAQDVGVLQLKDNGKVHLLRKDVESDVPAAVVKRLKSDEFSRFNFDFDKQQQEG